MTSIGSNQLFDRAQHRMSALTARADDLQSQISTNKKLTNASDDVSGWQRLQRLTRASSNDLVWSANIAVAQATLAQTDTALGSVTSRLQRAQELTVQAGNATLSNNDRAAIATELDAIVQDLNALAASKDARDTPLFGATATSIPIGEGQDVQPTETAARAFGTGSANVMTIITTLSTALKAGGSATAAAGAALAGLETGSANVAATRASVGARAARVDLVSERMADIAADRDIERSSIEDVDLTATITELQKTMTVLEATQASFSKLSQLSLFDYLR